jgi:hypothetical protein
MTAGALAPTTNGLRYTGHGLTVGDIKPGDFKRWS